LPRSVPRSRATIGITSAQARSGSLAFAPIAAVAWVGFALLGLAVKVALFPVHRTSGATALLWGFGFGLFAWAGSASVGLEEARAIPLGFVVWAATALFIYLQGPARENPPAARPWAFYHRRRATRARSRRYTHAHELHHAKVAVADGDRAEALFYLRQAEHVAVAQGKADELREVRALMRRLRPADANVVGIVPNRELLLAQRAIANGDDADARFWLREAEKVAVAQGKADELRDVRELLRTYS
jgi:hypothetical protein